MPKLKALLLLHELTMTGAPKSILNFFSAFQDRVDLWILAPNAGPLEARCRSLGRLTLLSPLLEAGNLAGRVRRKLLRNRWDQEMRQWSPDIIYVNSIAALKLLRWIELPPAPVILHVHELRVVVGSQIAGMEDLFLRRPDRYVAVSQAVSEMLNKDYGIPAEKIATVYPGIPDDLLEARALRSPEAENRRFTVGGSGAPSLRKGTTLWLQMARELTRLVAPTPVRFMWVGAYDDIECRLFADAARKLGLGDSVEFIPVTPEPGRYFAEFDVFAMTSWEDPCPAVVTESMLLQAPAVCFADSGGAPDVIGDTGFVVEGFSPCAMAEVIAQLMRAPEKRLALGRAAQQRVKDHFALSIQAPKLYRELEKAVKTERVDA